MGVRSDRLRAARSGSRNRSKSAVHTCCQLCCGASLALLRPFFCLCIVCTVLIVALLVSLASVPHKWLLPAALCTVASGFLVSACCVCALSLVFCRFSLLPCAFSAIFLQFRICRIPACRYSRLFSPRQQGRGPRAARGLLGALVAQAKSRNASSLRLCNSCATTIPRFSNYTTERLSCSSCSSSRGLTINKTGIKRSPSSPARRLYAV